MNSREMRAIASQYIASLFLDRADQFENWKLNTIRDQLLDDILGESRTIAAERRLRKSVAYVIEKKLGVPLNFKSPSEWRKDDD
jgi:hypothetical protein